VDLEGLAVVTVAFADIASDVDIGQEVHFDPVDAVAAAGLAAAALDIEAEAAVLVATGAGVLGAGKQLPDQVEHSGIGRRVGARGPSNRRLVDRNDFVEMLESCNPVESAGKAARTIEVCSQFFKGCH